MAKKSMLENPSHPLWKIIRTAVVGSLLVAFLSLNYNKMDERDITTVLGIAAGLLGFDFTKDKITGSSKRENSDGHDVSEVES